MKMGSRASGASAFALSLALLGMSSTALAQGAATPAPADPGLAPAATPAAATTPAAPAPTTPAPAPAEAVPGGAVQGGTNAGAAYTVRLHDLERRTDELKELVYRSKARLNLLAEMVLHQGSSVSHAVIMHRNEMGSTYTLVKLVYALDGAEIYSRFDDTGHLGDAKEFEVYNGALVPGNHTLSVMMVYQGNGFGVFSYLKGYKFTVKGSQTFTATEGKQTQLKVVGFEQGNPITTDPKDRPAIDFRTNVVADKPSQTDPAKPAAPAAASPEGAK